MNLRHVGKLAGRGLAVATTWPKPVKHGLAFVAVGGGGALTGYLASGTAKGAFIGALVHAALFGLVGAVFGTGRLDSSERVAYGAVGLGAAVGAGYLFYIGRRR